MIKKQMLDELGDQLGAKDTTAQVKQLRWLNMALQRVSYDIDFPQLRREKTLSITTDTYDYTLPGDVMVLAPDDFMTIPSEESRIDKISHHDMRLLRPGLIEETERHVPAIFAERQWVGVSAQPSSASVIAVSSGGTESNLLVTIEGVVSSEIDREEVALDGATPSANSTKSFTEVHSISKSAISGGIITATSNGAAVTLCTLGRLQYTKRYIQIRVNPIPDQAYTVYYDAIPFLPELVNDADIPLIPERHHETIVKRALMYGFMYNSKTNYRLAAAEYQDLIEFARRETGRDQGKVKAWTFGGDLDLGVISPWNFDAFLRRLYWGW